MAVLRPSQSSPEFILSNGRLAVNTKTSDSVSKVDALASDSLNLETAKISWSELERHFARGIMIVVTDGEDLVEIARAFVDDDSGRVKSFRDRNIITEATLEHARQWQPENATLWAVVVAPWVLVQKA